VSNSFSPSGGSSFDRDGSSRFKRARHRDDGPTPCEFIDLIEEKHDRPARELAPLIRRSLVERRFAGIGDAADHHSPEEIDRAVEELVEALESVRLARLRDGTWSSAPVPPLMCG
jgi:hypothetical protein